MRLRLLLIICACVVLDWYIKNNVITKNTARVENKTKVVNL